MRLHGVVLNYLRARVQGQSFLIFISLIKKYFLPNIAHCLEPIKIISGDSMEIIPFWEA
jgi:hypothetical protein